MVNVPHDDYVELKTLLTSWNVLELLPHFCDEGINVEELQMMKYHHVDLLLCNFKLGLRIRFEHHFERWRQQLGKPLTTASARCCNCSCWLLHRQRPAIQMSPISRAGEQLQSAPSPPLQLPMLQRRPTTPQSQLLTQMEFSASCPPSQPNTPLDVQSSDRTIAEPDVEVTIENESKDSFLELSPIVELSTLAPQTQIRTPTPTPTPTLPQPPSNEATVSSSVGMVSTILQAHGQKILDFYAEFQKLLPEHRVQVIDLIVRYHRMNQIHMSLNASYRLEEEILHLFPNEKLHSYRTNKRGKLYIKYSNSKRSRNYLSYAADCDKRGSRNLRTRTDTLAANVFVELPVDVQIKTEQSESNH